MLLGIDPGWKNLGAAVLLNQDKELRLLRSWTWDVSGGPTNVPGDILQVMDNARPTDVTIERYVPYNNTFSAEAENITMLIGGLRQRFSEEGADVYLVRAIDWKTALVKILVKYYGFDNPSTSLDKKFSVAAAKCLLKLDNLNITDHEADAICLAAFPLLCSWHKVPTAENGKTRTVN